MKLPFFHQVDTTLAHCFRNRKEGADFAFHGESNSWTKRSTWCLFQEKKPWTGKQANTNRSIGMSKLPFESQVRTKERQLLSGVWRHDEYTTVSHHFWWLNRFNRLNRWNRLNHMHMSWIQGCQGCQLELASDVGIYPARLCVYFTLICTYMCTWVL